MKENNCRKEEKYNKLVRDKIPEIIEKNGETPITRTLPDREYKLQLELKLYEEYKEVLAAKSKENRLEELADMIEVISSLANLEEESLEKVIEISENKKKQKGSFKNKIYLEKVINSK